MKMKLFTLPVMLLMLFVASTAKADSVSEKKARNIASDFFASHTMAGAKSADGAFLSQNLSMVQTSGEDPAYYIFNAKDANAYVIVSGEDQLPQLLGYSLEGTWPSDANLIPTPLKNALQNYAAYVEALREGKVEATESATVSMDAQPVVEPLITTKWNQNYPYNKYAPQCPDTIFTKTYGSHYPIGCAAVALGQLINYWGQKTGKPAHPNNINTFATFQNFYNASGEVTIDTVEYSLTSEKTYDYANIPDSIGYRPDTINIMSQEEWEQKGEAVGQFLADVAYSLNMQWSAAGGGGSELVASSDILLTNFGFSQDACCVFTLGKAGLKETKYMNKIKENLDKGWPVMAGGSDIRGAGGHGFIFDGYDTNDFVHVNWGWGGACNNWFDLSYLKTDQYDAKAKAKYNFILQEQILFDVHPKEEGVVETPKLDTNNVQLLCAGVASNNGGLNRAKSNMSALTLKGFQAPFYIDRQNTGFVQYYQAISFHKSFGYDYDLRCVIKDVNKNEEYAEVLRDSQVKNYGMDRSAFFMEQYKINMSGVPEGMYAFDGQIREVLNGETSDWVPAMMKDTILVEGSHVIMNPSVYNSYYHAPNCIHYLQDSNNKIYVHMEYDKDPSNLKVGDELNIILGCELIQNPAMKTNPSALQHVFLAEYDDDPQNARVALDLTPDVNYIDSLTAKQEYYYGGILDVYTKTFTEEDAGKTFHYLFAWPNHGLAMLNEITVLSTTGISDVNDGESTSKATKRFNVAGMAVGKDYHGIVIENGKKTLR